MRDTVAMALLRLEAAGVGPFEKVEIDFSDGHGNPHLGPHILAGVNGSGKSTVLRSIAAAWWSAVLVGQKNENPFEKLRTTPSADVSGFPEEEWLQLIVGWPDPWVKIEGRLWSRRSFESTLRPINHPGRRPQLGNVPQDVTIAAYSPSRALRFVPSPDISRSLPSAYHNSLAFEGTINNEVIQAWLLSTYSRSAIAQQRQQATQQYKHTLDRFESALRRIYDTDVRFEPEIEPTLQPRFRISGRSLNFSQLPDGVKSTVAWIADFMMRQDLMPKGPQGGVLLLDEADAHLHPLWQRRLLPAMRGALPGVQIIVSSHSPFVISSCLGSRVHIFETTDGRAQLRQSVDAPIGESVTTVLQEIFGVDSRFDVQTEEDLNKWNDLKKDEAAGKLGASARRQLQQLTQTLSDRSEELRLIVGAPRLRPVAGGKKRTHLR